MDRAVCQLAPAQGDNRGGFVPATIAIAPDDLPLLEQGGLGLAQRRALWRSRLAAILGVVAGGLALALLAGLGIVLGAGAPAIPALPALLLFAVGASWLWQLRHTPALARRIGRDLRSGKATLIDGEVSCSFRQSIGLFRWLRYRLGVGGRIFIVPREVFEQFLPGRPYRVFFAPESGCFLGALELAAPLPPPATAAPPPSPVPAAPPATDLTAQEREILRLIAAGLSNKEIAARLSLSVNTIKMYCSQIYLKLDVHRRTEAVARAREIGLL